MVKRSSAAAGFWLYRLYLQTVCFLLQERKISGHGAMSLASVMVSNAWLELLESATQAEHSHSGKIHGPTE